MHVPESDTHLRKDALQILSAGIQAVHAGHLVSRILAFDGNVLRVGSQSIGIRPHSRIFALGAGKASSSMAREVEAVLGERLTGGLVVTKYGLSSQLLRLPTLESGHPLPDQNSLVAATTMRRLVTAAGKNDIILFLLSGGTSSLIFEPPAAIPLAEVQFFFDLLLKCGLPIKEMNVLRKSLSKIHAGRLAKLASPATVVTLTLSDVPGDDPEVIGSGPTFPDTTIPDEILDLLSTHGLKKLVPKRVNDYYVELREKDFVRKDDPCFRNAPYEIVGNNRMALDGCLKKALQLGYETSVANSGLHGESRERGRELALQARRHLPHRPTCRLVGGETAVTVRGSGVGGRNQELALAALCERKVTDRWLAAAVATDGDDGTTSSAGAIADQVTTTHAVLQRLNPRSFLSRNDSHTFFTKTDGLILTGPTDTNVMDIALTLTPGDHGT